MTKRARTSAAVRRGGLSRLALEAKGGPMTTRELAESIISVKGWDGADKVLREGVTYRLVQALTIAAKRRAIHSPGKLRNVRLWAFLPQP